MGATVYISADGKLTTETKSKETRPLTRSRRWMPPSPC
ncbi:hypothetical protein WJ973_12640 [Achromobacter xylosoxidans]